MKKLLVLVTFVWMCSAGTAQAGVFSTVGGAGIYLWNILPGVIRVVNGGIHFVCDTVHTGLHATADFLQIENLP